jgi:hypothetical protein
MSWYIRKLLTESDRIKREIKKEFGFLSSTDLIDNCPSPDTASDYPFDSDEYSDLLTVEVKIRELIDNNSLTKNEILAVACLKLNRASKRLVGKTIFYSINSLLNKLAYHLGYYFTNEGYLNHLKTKYKLSDDDIIIARTYIEKDYN